MCKARYYTARTVKLCQIEFEPILLPLACMTGRSFTFKNPLAPSLPLRLYLIKLRKNHGVYWKEGYNTASTVKKTFQIGFEPILPSLACMTCLTFTFENPLTPSLALRLEQCHYE